MIYAFIEEHAEYPVVRWAGFFEVSTSGYYAWRNERTERAAREESSKERIRTIFEGSKGTYGAERICGALRKCGEKASYPRVKRQMEEMGLRSMHRRRTRALTDSRKARGEGYENLLKGLSIEEPFEAVSSDISYIPTGEGFDYLCQIKDIATGIILAERMSERMTKELVLDTIRAAQRGWRLPEGTIFHSDRGSQYTSKEVRALLMRLGFRQSFSRVGMPGDNAWSESFFSIIKKELVHIARFETRADARQAVFEYIHGFYNTRRIQKRLGYLSPFQWIDARRISSLRITA